MHDRDRSAATVHSDLDGDSFPVMILALGFDCRQNQSGCKVIAMMQATQPREPYNIDVFARLLRCAICRSLFVQPKMGSIIVIVTDELGHEPLEMALVERHYMVEEIAAA